MTWKCFGAVFRDCKFLNFCGQSILLSFMFIMRDLDWDSSKEILTVVLSWRWRTSKLCVNMSEFVSETDFQKLLVLSNEFNSPWRSFSLDWQEVEQNCSPDSFDWTVQIPTDNSQVLDLHCTSTHQFQVS